MEKYCAPVLIGMSAALLAWAYGRAGGFGPMLSAQSQFVVGGAKEGQFWAAFFPALTANVGFWATLSLNIPGTIPSHHLALPRSPSRCRSRAWLIPMVRSVVSYHGC